jgi:dUTP pyrophosphatase
MLVDIHRVDQSLPLPRYQTEGSVAFDLVAREGATIAPGEIAIVPSNVIVAVPEGFVLMLAARSSLAAKKGLMLANSVGLVDGDYSGPQDEIGVSLYNFGKEPSLIERGERIAQGLLVKIGRAEWNEVDRIDRPSRGGFGSTGGYREPES